MILCSPIVTVCANTKTRITFCQIWTISFIPCNCYGFKTILKVAYVQTFYSCYNLCSQQQCCGVWEILETPPYCHLLPQLTVQAGQECDTEDVSDNIAVAFDPEGELKVKYEISLDFDDDDQPSSLTKCRTTKFQKWRKLILWRSDSVFGTGEFSR